MGERVVVGMSGGVDSSVAAVLLLRAGFDVVGVTLRLADAEDVPPGRCCSIEDLADARAAAAGLGIPHYVADERVAFQREIVEPFVREHARGRTPSPCVHCNPRLKLAALLRFAQATGAGSIATGHYARIVRGAGGIQLLRGLDQAKDQSYFLFGLTPEQLHAVRFPLGELTKTEVRALAGELGLRVAAKRDSQELCFVPGGDHRAFVVARGGAGRPGAIRDAGGTVLGVHQGTHAFTVGQRHGVPAGPRGARRYVLRIDASNGDVVVGSHDELACRAMTVTGVRFLGPQPVVPLDCAVQIRYRARPVPCRILGQRQDVAHVALREPAFGPAPGQAAVFYEGDRVLGGGLIEQVLPSTSSDQA